MRLVSFDTSWKHRKIRGFLMFSGGIKGDQWHGLTHHLKLHAGEKPSKCIFLITVAHEIFEWRFALGFVLAENINVKYVIFVVLRKAIWNVNSINMLVKEPVAVDIGIIFVQEDISWNFMKDYIGIKFYSSGYCEIFISRNYLSSIWEHTRDTALI